MIPHIIPMRKEHIEQVSRLDALCFAVPWTKKAFENEMANNLACYHILEDQGKIVGYGGYWHVLNEAHITNIAILPSRWRQGLGGKLLDYLISDARGRGVNWMTLEVRVSNVGARRLYEKYGFRQTGVRPCYYSDNREDALIMTKQW